MFQHHVDFLQLRIVDHFEQTDNIGMADLLQDGDFSLCLVFRRNGDSSQLALLGEALYDLDRNKVTRLKTSCQFDLAMHAPADLFNDLVLVYQFAAGNEVLLDLGFVGPGLHMSVV